MTVTDMKSVKYARRHGTSADMPNSRPTGTSARIVGLFTNKWVVRSLLTIALYLWAMDAAPPARGYEAIGGEELIWGLPIYIEVAGRTLKDWIREIREWMGEK